MSIYHRSLKGRSDLSRALSIDERANGRESFKKPAINLYHVKKFIRVAWLA